MKFSYPLIENYIPAKYKNSPSTIALIHAISHQESNFRVKHTVPLEQEDLCN